MLYESPARMKDWDFGTYNAVRCLGMEMPVWYLSGYLSSSGGCL